MARCQTSDRQIDEKGTPRRWPRGGKHETMNTALIPALVTGLRRAQRLALLLPLYLAGLLLGLVQTWPLWANGRGTLTNPFLGVLATGGADALVDLFLGRPEAGGQAAQWVLGTLGLALVFGGAYNFFAGGILEAWTGRRRFWAGCWRFFLPFVALGALLLPLALLAGVLAALAGSFLGGAAGGVVAALALLLLNAVGEAARALAVARDRRNPFVLLGRAFAFCARHPGLLLLALAGALLHAALAALYAALAAGIGNALLLIAAQQLAVLGWLWVKLLRLAWALSYVEAADGQAASRLEISPPAGGPGEPQLTILE
jgi:hypothetical protein